MNSNINKKGPLLDKQVPNIKVQAQNKGIKKMSKTNITKIGKKENDKIQQSKGKVGLNMNMTNLQKEKTKQTPILKSNFPSKTEITSKNIEPTMKQTKQVNKAIKSTMMTRFQQAKNLQLAPCHTCGRTFVPQSLKRHEKICKKVFVNKRKQFNSVKQRIVSKEQVKLMKMSNIKEIKQKPNNKINAMPLWKQQSLAFRLAMKQVKGGKKSQQQLAFQQKEKKILHQGMFKCKGCSRFFNEEAGKRHEQFCLQKLKNMQNKAKKR